VFECVPYPNRSRLLDKGTNSLQGQRRLFVFVVAFRQPHPGLRLPASDGQPVRGRPVGTQTLITNLEA
jgi:hypothetical protein